MAVNQKVEREFRQLNTPRAAAIAGILFGVLFTVSVALVRTSVPETITGDLSWLEQYAGRITAAIVLMPFAGIAFLWFVGVVRDRLGNYEDRFFSSVFFGSGLLFLAMAFVSMAIAGAILAISRLDAAEGIDPSVVYFARAMMLQITNVYALRMAGVFMISLATIWLRTGLLPRGLALLTYLLALALLVVINLSLWVAIVFPAWVFGISVLFLLSNLNQKEQPA